MKITQIPSCIQVFVLNKINFQSKLEFYSKAWFLFFFFLFFFSFFFQKIMLPSPKFLEQMQTLENDHALPYYWKFLQLGLPSYHRRFFWYFDLLTLKWKYILHTISPVKLCRSRQFGRLQRNICCLLHTCQPSLQGEVRALLPIAIASLPSTQKHFHCGLYIHTYARD